MSRSINTPYVTFRRRAIRHMFISPLGQDNQLAHPIGQPLFDAGIDQAAISERLEMHHTLTLKGYHEVSLVLQGGLHIVINGQAYDQEPGDLAICPAGTTLQRSSGESGVWWIYFSILDLPAWEPFKKLKATVRRYESATLMFLLLRDTLDILKDQHPVAVLRAQDNCRALVNLLRYEMIRPGMTRSQNFLALQKLAEAIGKAPEKRWNRRSLAEAMNLSISQMTRLFRDHFGYSPKELVIRQRMMKATQLLANPSRKIESIAEEVGYGSLHAFTHIFTKHVGIPPSTYRTRYVPSGAASR